MRIIYNANSFGGLNLAAGATSGNVVQCDNLEPTVDQSGTTLFHGFLTKFPKSQTAGDMVGTSKTRGLFAFVPSTYAVDGTFRYLQAFSDGTVRYLNSTNQWTTITSGFSEGYPMNFEQFSALDRVFWTNGREAIRKWSKNWSTSTPLKDKSATATALTGTVTFNENSKSVTGSGTAFDSELASGDWIRKSSTTDWYEVRSVTSSTALTLESDFLEATGAGSSGGSQKAANSTIRARFINFWKNRMMYASGDASALPIVGTATCNDAATPLP